MVQPCKINLRNYHNNYTHTCYVTHAHIGNYTKAHFTTYYYAAGVDIQAQSPLDAALIPEHEEESNKGGKGNLS